MTLPLEGTSVLDLSRLAPGPYCTWLLGDLGADVLRVEEPQVQARRPEEDEVRVRRLAHDAIGRNKRSIALNLKEPAAREVFCRLADRADVVVEGFRPGVVDRLGVDYATLSLRNPRLVYCSISGYGQTGPLRLTPGHDVNYTSLGGALGIIGLEEDGRPAIPANLLADYAGGGLMAALAILAALLARAQTGKGQYIDMAMSEGVLGLMAGMISTYFASGAVPLRGSGGLTGGRAHYQLYQTKDQRWVSIGSLEPHFFVTTCHLLGCEDFIPFQNDATRQEEMKAAFQRAIGAKTRDEWVEIFAGQEVCFMPVYSLDESLSHPQIQARGMVLTLNHPTAGPVRQVASPLKLTQTPPQVRRFAAFTGQHTDEVLAELGYSLEEVTDLRDSGVFG